MRKPPVIFILGPTASGKTAVAVEVARSIGGEIISCDSMQVYTGMDVINQAPDDRDISLVPHHLVRELSPSEEFSAAMFANRARDAITLILGRRKVPVIAGGTGLYVKALVDGMFSAPPKDREYREHLERLADEKGALYLHGKLAGTDPDTADKIHENDVRRIIRALEVRYLTGKTMHDKKKETAGIADIYDCRMFGLSIPREELYRRIEARVDRMFDEGIVEEVKSLVSGNLSITAGKALGIKEIKAALDGAYGMDRAREELKKNTRRYAKRQLTWFNADHRIEWINARGPSDRTAREIERKVPAGGKPW